MNAKELLSQIIQMQAASAYMHDPLGQMKKIESLLSAALRDCEFEVTKIMEGRNRAALEEARTVVIRDEYELVDKMRAAAYEEGYRAGIKENDAVHIREEGFQEGLELGNAKLKEDFKPWTDVAKREAYEDCAKIAAAIDEPGLEDYCGSEIAKKIRAKASEVGK